jgi:Fe-S oxidoreductase
MATYKAEFLSHYYAGRVRPAPAYAFGLIARWARLASTMPAAVNALSHMPGMAALIKLAVGMPQEREVPAFAPFTFQQWARHRRRARVDHRPPVLLWPDTFNNYFHPTTAIAATHVLERAGFRVLVPNTPVCCGRPLYDYGMLDTAARWLRQILTRFSTAIGAGVPVVGLEPSCVTVFRDEMRELLPDDVTAKRLQKQVFTLSEFLRQRAPDFRYPLVRRRAIVHGHCHHKAVLKMDADREVLGAMGLDYQLLDSGCCGMAGSFGFERRHFDISRQIGELVLLPAVRAAAAGSFILADGFSCREQIAQLTDRRAFHLADLLHVALRDGPSGLDEEYPERAQIADYVPPARRHGRLALAVGAGAAAFYFLRPRRCRYSP